MIEKLNIALGSFPFGFQNSCNGLIIPKLSTIWMIYFSPDTTIFSRASI